MFVEVIHPAAHYAPTGRVAIPRRGDFRLIIRAN